MTGRPADPRCVNCGHHHYGPPSGDGGQWCDCAAFAGTVLSLASLWVAWRIYRGGDA